MITGGTSPFPIWAILLTIAVPLTALTIFAAIKVWKTSGFSEPSKRRIAFFVITALTLSTWVGYGITSRERWASRAFAVEVTTSTTKNLGQASVTAAAIAHRLPATHRQQPNPAFQDPS